MVHDDPFYGRVAVIRFVRDLMVREEAGRSLRNQRFPILVIEGARGTGKTALLSAMERLLDQRVPHANLNFEATGGASITPVLSALAFELGRKCPRYGALRFPRFTIGQVVRELDLDPNDHAQARRQVIEALAHRRGIDAIRADLVNWAGALLTGLSGGVPVEPPRNVFMLALRSLTARAPARIVLGVYQDWYGHRDLGQKNDSIDVLVVLNRWSKNKKDKINRQRVDELLLEAFLADLRNELDRGRKADERSFNCVILLDNTDSRLGRRFLHELVDARRQRSAARPDGPDPLTVVATSREAWLADEPEADWEWVALDDNSPPRQPHSSRVWWLRHQLLGLTEAEIRFAVLRSAPTVDSRRATQVLLRLTENPAGSKRGDRSNWKGHAGAIQLAVEALARRPQPDKIELGAILSQPPSGKDSDRWTTVEHQMLDRLLYLPTAKTPMRDLVTCTAARELRHALALAAQDDLVASDQANYLETHEPVLWPAGRDELALPRRLLQRRLARRDPAVAPSWSTVYGRLRDTCTEGDQVSELYYALAADDLEFVTRRLHQRLAELEDTAWLELLRSVTAAPRREPPRQDLADEVRMIVHATRLEKPLDDLARLIATLWIAADPLIDSERDNLHQEIVNDYKKVTNKVKANDLTDVFSERIELWSD